MSITNKNPPKFVESLKDQKMIIMESLTYTVPQVVDEDNDGYIIEAYSYKNLSLPNFAIFNTKHFIFIPKENDVGVYKIYVRLNDTNINPKSKTYNFFLNVTDLNRTELNIKKKEEERIRNESIIREPAFNREN